MSIPRIPGENVLYRDMYDVIATASEEMQLGQMLTMPNTSMLDAMNAIKIGDSRMDSGFGNGNLDNKPDFDVNSRLLPDEVCWLLDQSFAAEMAWHQGITLTQTVFTILYVHHLGSYNSWSVLQGVESTDPRRPAQLVNIVLAAGMLGMTKCVDLAWREFAKGCVYEHEDWQADKAGVIIMEHVSTRDVLSLLKSATDWLQSYKGLDSRSRQALLERLQLRKLWLNTLHLQLPTESGSLFAHVAQTRHALARVRSFPVVAPSMASSVQLGIDPDIKRRLKFTSPLEAISLPNMPETWDFFDELLAGLGDACDISDKRSPLNWESLLLLASRQKPSPRYCAFVRASTSYAMYDGSCVLGELDPEWLVDTVLQELTCLPGGATTRLLNVTAGDSLAATMEQCILKFAELLLNYYTTLCHNRPRQRRIYSNALSHWRDLLLIATDLETRFELSFPDAEEMETFNRIHLTIQYYRCLLALEVIFSGFELELYNKAEWLSVLRFASGLLRRKANILNMLLNAVPDSAQIPPGVEYLQAQTTLTNSLQSMVYGLIMGMLSNNPSHVLLSSERQQQNMERRFKWALPENSVQDDLQPDWSDNSRWIEEHALGDPANMRAEAIKWFNAAEASIEVILREVEQIPFYDLCRPAFKATLSDLIRTCQKSSVFWSKANQENLSPPAQIYWASDAHPWFLVPYERL
ncbi:hypothetical protein CALVIDRAFT_601528 [Calocera viscosa TUFC12733]|uniref:Mak10-domain-containing protein n=1 Tax=Calocera viscosa (strain TUFC12733) TaxID=1330018 RepID=A0A167I6M5_CALVF|nr:hypothetical protein CALVIDRAFT_601528 [Calocera viscosa TUFC12733]